MGGSEGTFLRPERQASGDDDRGPSLRLCCVRRRDPGRELRRGQRDHLGQRDLGVRRTGRRSGQGAERRRPEVPDEREEDVWRVGALSNQGTVAEGQRVASRETPRSVREREHRHHRSRAEVGRIESHARRCRCRQDVAEQSSGELEEDADIGFPARRRGRRRYTEEGYEVFEEAGDTCSSAASSSFRSESKLAR